MDFDSIFQLSQESHSYYAALANLLDDCIVEFFVMIKYQIFVHVDSLDQSLIALGFVGKFVELFGFFVGLFEFGVL